MLYFAIAVAEKRCGTKSSEKCSMYVNLLEILLYFRPPTKLQP